MWSTPIFDQLPTKAQVLSAQVSQGFPGFLKSAARTCSLVVPNRRAGVYLVFMLLKTTVANFNNRL